MILMALPIQSIFSQPKPQKPGERTYRIDIVEDTTQNKEVNDALERKKESFQSNRSAFLLSLLSNNRTAFVSKLANTAENLIGSAISHLGERLTNPRDKWEREVRKECLFKKPLKMEREINDFYSDISSKGPLDPDNIKFSGFECRQDIVLDSKKTANVFYVSCKIDPNKIGRMITHSKFEVYVDTVRFNPYISDLPNDSLNDISKRIPFDFKNRKDLTLLIHADVTSSWINEGAMIFSNQKIGEFDIEIKIDSNFVSDSVFTYSSKNAADAIKNNLISVKGESFVVPRSYAGNYGESGHIWGTGQYKIDMMVTEICQINLDYYKDTVIVIKDQQKKLGDGPKPEKNLKWNDNWQSEWKLIYSRKKGDFWKGSWNTIKTMWAGDRWITEVTSPTTSYIITEGSNILRGGTTNNSTSTQPTQNQNNNPTPPQ